MSNSISKPLLGNVLVPDSSPINSKPSSTALEDVIYKPHQSKFFSNTEMARSAQLPSLPTIRRELDPLSAPTGFTTSQTLLSISQSPDGVTTKNSRTLEDDNDRGPPRKRINRGELSSSPIVIESSPDSKISISSTPPAVANKYSSDSELPDPLDLFKSQTPPKPRVVRGPRLADQSTSVELTKLILINPKHDPARVTAAFTVCDGDVKAATLLMEDESWTHEVPQTPASSQSIFASQTPDSVSKRAAEKVKRKQSMIYAKRSELAAAQETIVPAKHEAVISIDSPIISKPFKRKGAKNVVASSASENEYSDNDDEDFSSQLQGQAYFDQALKWLNECEPTAIVELAGGHLIVF